MRRLSAEEKYSFKIRKQDKALEEFAEHEIEWAGDLILWYGSKKEDMPDDEYKACLFFKEFEFLNKPGSLTLLYHTYLQCMKELPPVTKELAFDLLSYRYKAYAMTLNKGGFLDL